MQNFNQPPLLGNPVMAADCLFVCTWSETYAVTRTRRGVLRALRDHMSREKKQIMQRYVSLLTNSRFKAVFGDRANKDVVMSVINILLPEGKQVDDIEYMPTELQGPMQESKEFQYDFMCTGTDGTDS